MEKIGDAKLLDVWKAISSSGPLIFDTNQPKQCSQTSKCKLANTRIFFNSMMLISHWEWLFRTGCQRWMNQVNLSTGQWLTRAPDQLRVEVQRSERQLEVSPEGQSWARTNRKYYIWKLSITLFFAEKKLWRYARATEHKVLKSKKVKVSLAKW